MSSSSSLLVDFFRRATIGSATTIPHNGHCWQPLTSRSYFYQQCYRRHRRHSDLAATARAFFSPIQRYPLSSNIATTTSSASVLQCIPYSRGRLMLFHAFASYSSSSPSSFRMLSSATASSANIDFDLDFDDNDESDDTAAVIDSNFHSNSTQLQSFTTLSPSMLHPASLHAITHKLKLSTMTEIQQLTFHAASSGQDVLGRARTGTGKTLAFLLPALESALREGRVPGPPSHPDFIANNLYNQENEDDEKEQQQKKRGGIAILIISPTRELAMQIHSQAQIITSSHSNSIVASTSTSSSNHQHKHHHHHHRYPMTSQVMYGGTSRLSDIAKLETNIPFILVATPGRLIDHMQSTTIHHRGSSIPFRELIANVSVWVLDEADRCLDMGFSKDMEYILSHKSKGREDHPHRRGERMVGKTMGRRTLDESSTTAPASSTKVGRGGASAQTLLFSATLPDNLRAIMASHMRPGYLTVDCIQGADTHPASQAHANVEQRYVTLPPPALPTSNNANNQIIDNNDHNQGRYISGLVSILEDIIHHQNPNDYKIIVFFPTTATCQFFSHIFNTIYRIPVLEIHSKKAQSNRTIMSEKFRKFPKGILCTTDVSARGVDYPSVTHVIQYGGAEDKETYLHRLGRTGRAGKAGRGLIVCTCKNEERTFVKRVLGGLEVHHDGRIQALLDNNNGESSSSSSSSSSSELIDNSFGSMNKKREEINNVRLQKIRSSIGKRLDSDLEKMANNAYRSLLGYSITKMENLGMRTKNEVVEHVNSLAMQMGYLPGKLPTIGPKIIQALGLHGIRGLNVGKDYRSNVAMDDGDIGTDGRSGGGHGGKRGVRSKEYDNRTREGSNRDGRGHIIKPGRDQNPWTNPGGQQGGKQGGGREQSGRGGKQHSNFRQFDDYRWDI